MRFLHSAPWIGMSITLLCVAHTRSCSKFESQGKLGFPPSPPLPSPLPSSHDIITSVARLLRPVDVRDSVTRVLQQRGINVRFLGLIRHHCRDPVVRGALLVEMIARVIQKHLRRVWRSHRQSSMLPILRETVSVLNSIPEGPNWIVPELLAKFGENALTEKEMDPRELPLCPGILRACKLAGVAFPTGHTAGLGGSLTLSDIALEPVTKELNVSARAEAVALAQEARRASPHRGFELLQIAIRVIRFELISDPASPLLHLLLVRMLLAASKRAFIIENESSQPSNKQLAVDPATGLIAPSPRQSGSARSPRGTPPSLASLSSSARCSKSSSGLLPNATDLDSPDHDLLKQALKALDKLPPDLNDRHLLQCRYYRILMHRDADSLEAASAIQHWKSAVASLDLCSSAEENWLSFSDTKGATRALAAQRAKLSEEALLCVRAMSRFSEDHVVYGALAPHLGWLRQHNPTLFPEDLSDPRVVWLSILLLDATEMRERFSKHPILHQRLSLPFDISLAPLDNDMLSALRGIGFPKLEVLSLENGMFDDAEFAKVAEWAPLLQSLELHHCNCITLAGLLAGLRNMAHLRALKIHGMGRLRGDLNALFQGLPAQLRELEVWGQPRLWVGETVACLPAGLTVFKLWHCEKLAPTVGLVNRLQELPALRHVWLERVAEPVAMCLPRQLHSIHLEFSAPYSQPLPTFPELRHVQGLGTNVCDIVLGSILRTSPLLETLHVPGNHRISDAAFGHAKLVHLTDVDLSACSGALTNATLRCLEHGQIIKWDSREVYGITSAELAPFLSANCVQKVNFTAPREPLLFRLGSLVDGIVSIHLADTAQITDAGWDALCRNAKLLESIELSNLRGFDDARIEAILMGTSKLRKLILRNLILAKGDCLVHAAESGRTEHLEYLTVVGV